MAEKQKRGTNKVIEKQKSMDDYVTKKMNKKTERSSEEAKNKTNKQKTNKKQKQKQTQKTLGKPIPENRDYKSEEELRKKK